jgi:hypothetical protein
MIPTSMLFKIIGSNPTPRAYLGGLYKIKEDTSVID